MTTRRRFLRDLSMAAGTALLGGHAFAASRVRPGAGQYRLRSVGGVVTGSRHSVQGVLNVRRTIPPPRGPELDPFIMLDHFDQTLPPGYSDGIKPHPHRGLETITLMMEGAVEHRDSLGNVGLIQRGDIQWMTAGSGIVHSEYPFGPDGRPRGGRVHGVQLWLNLPRRLKMRPPLYQDTVNEAIPVVDADGVTARAFAGDVHGVQGIVTPHTPVRLVAYTLSAGASVTIPLAAHWNAFVHVVEGQLATLGLAVPLRKAQLAWYTKDGEGIHVTALGGPARFVLGAGEPLNEPIARGGPFVMNTRAEIREAFADYRAGRMGFVPE